jgi:hypothetical protein
MWRRQWPEETKPDTLAWLDFIFIQPLRVLFFSPPTVTHKFAAFQEQQLPTLFCTGSQYTGAKPKET